MKHMLCALLTVPLLATAGCGPRIVDLVDQKAFIAMAQRMPAELQARSLLDRGHNYSLTLFPRAEEAYGKILFGRLSPDFLAEGETLFRARTFQELASPEDRTSITRNGFSIASRRQTITVSMIGILDWDGKGEDSWLISCLVEPRVGRSREHYILIPAPHATNSILKGKPAAVYECFGLSCTMYVHNSALPAQTAPVADPRQAGTPVRESLPGLNQITAPPQKQENKSLVRERNL